MIILQAPSSLTSTNSLFQGEIQVKLSFIHYIFVHRFPDIVFVIYKFFTIKRIRRLEITIIYVVPNVSSIIYIWSICILDGQTEYQKRMTLQMNSLNTRWHRALTYINKTVTKRKSCSKSTYIFAKFVWTKLRVITYTIGIPITDMRCR